MAGSAPVGASPKAAPRTAAGGPITFTPGSGGAESVQETFVEKPNACAANQPQPVIASYPGTLEVGRLADGSLYLITQLSFSEYLKGIAEVPASWPAAALQAQVIAARTYAIAHMNSPTVDGLNYNLCSTDACQVYRGLAVADGTDGQDWTQAVDATSGQILMYQGRPADALYFSTSDGQTYSNSSVFGGTPLPYLQPVAEHDDSQSPVANWSVTMPLTDLAQALSMGGEWGSGPITTVSQQASSVAISGPGQSTTLTLSTFRNALNNNAVCLQPKRYPTAGASGGSLPQVVPSVWLTLQQSGNAIVMTGKGWGHGVGMVQWGAEGKAARGLSDTQILSYYYGGLQPVTVTEPGSIRVLLATGVQQVTVKPAGPAGAVQVSGNPGAASGALNAAVTITGGPALSLTAAPGAIGPTTPPSVPPAASPSPGPSPAPSPSASSGNARPTPSPVRPQQRGLGGPTKGSSTPWLAVAAILVLAAAAAAGFAATLRIAPKKR